LVKIAKLLDTSVLEPPARAPAAPSPQAIERKRQAELFRKQIESLRDESAAFAVSLEEGDKAATIRNRLLAAGRVAGREIAVRRYGEGFAVGLMTPARRSRRGRPRSSQGSKGAARG